jgi:hypothetical protein
MKERNHKLMPIIVQIKCVYNFNNLFKIKNNNLEEGIEYFSNWLFIEEGNEENKKTFT